MNFEDRVSAYPGRYVMTAEDGTVSYVVLERADEPIVPGTPLNAETFNNMFSELWVLNEDRYGSTLPSTGKKGELFFLKV